jgi:hypothetical protein
MPVVYDQGNYAALLGGAQGLGRGISRGLESLGESIAKIIEAKKTERKLAREAEKMYALLWEMPAAREVMKVPPEELIDSIPRREIPGAVANVMAALKIKGMMEESELRKHELLAQIEERMARARAIRSEEEAAAQLPAFFSAFSHQVGQPAVGPIPSEGLDEQGRYTPQGAFISAAEIAPRALRASQFDERARAIAALTGMGQATRESLPVGEAREVPGIGWVVGKGSGNPVEFHPLPREPRPAKAEPPEVQLPYLPWIDDPSDTVFSGEFQKFQKLLFDSGSDIGAINKVLDSIRARRKAYKEGRRPLSLNEQIAAEMQEQPTPATVKATKATVKATKAGRTIDIEDTPDKIKRAKELGWTVHP